MLFRFASRPAGSSRLDSKEPAESATRSGKTDLPPLRSGVPESRDEDEQVTGPFAGLGELEVERLAGWRNYFAVGLELTPRSTSGSHSSVQTRKRFDTHRHFSAMVQKRNVLDALLAAGRFVASAAQRR
jgi:hypothetical protein